MAAWNDSRLVVGAEQFVPMWDDLTAWTDAVRRLAHGSDGESTPPDVLAVCKTRPMLEQLVDHMDTHRPRRILELGIYTGGSTALLASLAPEAHIVAVELTDRPAPDLSDYITRTGAQDRVHAYYGVDQSDRTRLLEILAAEFGDQQLDLVIDDASHELEPSRASLDIVLPYVAHGGCYMVEDWSWSHTEDTPENELVRKYLPKGPGMTALILELTMAIGTQTDVIDRLDITTAWAKAWRGSAPIDLETFTLADVYHNTETIVPR